MSVMTYAQAIQNALVLAMGRDPSVFVMGIGVDDDQGIWGSTRGLAEQFGRERCFDTPISEAAMTGVATGCALNGMRPVHVHMRNDFLFLAMDQLFNIAAKWRYLFGGRMDVPLVVRAIVGQGGWGQGAQHSQSLPSFFMHIPGFKVAMPTTPYEAKGVLLAAIFDPNPVVLIEHRLLYPLSGEVPDAYYEFPLGEAVVRRRGTDVTLVANSHMAMECLKAAGELEKEGIEAEVVDPVSLVPLDEETLLQSVRKTGRLLVVDSGWATCGVSAEIAALVAEKAHPFLKQPVRRLGNPPVPCPVSQPLQNLFYPGKEEVIAGVLELIGERPAVGQTRTDA